MLDQDFTIFIHPPSEVDLLIRLDAMGTLYDRFITSVEAF